MSTHQLSLFSQKSDTMAKGFSKMTEFNFGEAAQIFHAIKESYIDTEPEIEAALACLHDWRQIFEELIYMQPSESILFLFDKIQGYNFFKGWGFKKFQSALLIHLIGLMEEQGRFYINKSAALSDLYEQIGNLEKAEKKLLDRLSSHPVDNHARFRLARLLWNSNLKGEAKRHYALSLLYDPQTLLYNFLECDNTAALISEFGPEMAPAYGWVKSIYPLHCVPDDITPVSENHSVALECYRLLRRAERSSKNNHLDACVEYRKALKERAPKFYEAYFALISKRRQPRLH